MRRLFALVISVMAAVLLTTATASAAPAAGTGGDFGVTEGPEGPTKMCVDTAHERNLDAWACMGSDLIVNGKVEHLAEDKKPMRPEVSTDQATPTQEWCEPVGLCTRIINDYTSETKANIWYGYGDENVGTYDATLRNNLNGRQPRLTTSLQLDGGPPLYFPDITTQCWEEITWWPDAECGSNTMGGAYLPGEFSTWRDGPTGGERLENSNEYYHGLSATFRPTGYPVQSGTLFETPYFYCWGEDPCYVAE
ncbi:hypothetical protein [Bounagaea algeriensis]